MNKVILIGNLTQDPEQKHTPSNVSFCRFTVAVNRNYSSSDGSRQTDFLPVVCWRNQADTCAKHLKKGSKVAICGSIQTRNYDVDGVKRYVTEIVAEEVRFLSTRNDDSNIPDIPEVQAQQRRPSMDDARPVTPADPNDLPF